MACSASCLAHPHPPGAWGVDDFEAAQAKCWGGMWRQVGQGSGQRAALRWVTAVWRGEGFGRENGRFALTLPSKAGADVVGKVVWQRQRFWRFWRRLVGKDFGSCERVSRERLVLSTRVMEGKRPFSCKLLGNSQRRSQFSQSSQSASAQRFNNFAQASRQRRWSGVPPNTCSS